MDDDDLVFFGARFDPAHAAPPERREALARDMLSRALNRKQVVAFVGAGCSAAAGYSLWRPLVSELVGFALDEARSFTRRDRLRFDVDRLAALRGHLDSGAEFEPRRLMWLAGEADSLVAHAHGGDGARLRRRAAEMYRPKGPDSGGPRTPHDALVELPVSRFITTNYDVEIERALARARRIDPAEFGVAGWPDQRPESTRRRSITQEAQYADRLALFALSRIEPREDMVFHCHGRFDRPESIVLTESDYQHWYLREGDPASSVFRQTLDLLFGSSPILFVGYGLGDDDLLRPLRLLSAREREPRDRTNPRGTARPLFALVASSDPAVVREQASIYLQRYGVHVIPYAAAARGGGDAASAALCDALDGLRSGWERWRDGWLEKPVIRRVVVRANPDNGPFWHYHPEQPPDQREQLGYPRINEQVDRLRDCVQGRARVVAIVGPGGTGKSWHAIRLAQSFKCDRQPFDGVFFWSSYYTNDRITGIDRLLEYADPGGSRSKSRQVRLTEILESKKLLVVFDGVERLLRPTDVPDEGEHALQGFRWMIDLFLRTQKSVFVLTSRLWPKQLTEAQAACPGAVERVVLEPMGPDDLDVPDFDGIEAEERSEICSLLDGHAFGLALAARHMAAAGPERRAGEFARLRSFLASRPPHARLAGMINEAIKAADRASGRLASALLERIAVFMGPVTESMLEVCAASACAAPGVDATDPGGWRRAVDDLIFRRLVTRISPGPQERRPPAYTAHPTVRTFVFEHWHAVDRDIVPNFTLPGYTSGTAAVYPGSDRSVALVRDMFGRLHDGAMAAIADSDMDEARHLCRGLFGVVRSRMEANTSPRWCTYDEHLSYTMTLANLAKLVSPRRWSHCDVHRPESVEDVDGPLYADEIAWLYNDIGLSLCGHGDMLDAYAAWEQGYAVNRVIEGMSTVRQYILQSQLHLGHVYIDIGQLDVADQYLADCERTNHELDDGDYRGRILGYRGLVAHLRNDLSLASELYRKAHRCITKSGRNARAESLFRMHHAALLVHQRKLDEAREQVRAAHAAAYADGHPDLLARAFLTHGTLLRAEGRQRDAVSDFDRALAESRRIGCRRLEADVLGEQSKLALDLGEFSVARHRAVEALRIANELSLGLRQTHGLVVLGRSLAASGQRDLGIAYLKHARTIGELQGYALRVEDAEQELVRLGVDLASPREPKSERGVMQHLFLECEARSGRSLRT